MICPYIPARHEQIEQVRREYDDGGLETFYERKLIDTPIILEMNCENCGAFYQTRDDDEPRCHFYQER